MRICRRFILKDGSLSSFLSSLGLDFTFNPAFEFAINYQTSYLQIGQSFFKLSSGLRQEIDRDEFEFAVNNFNPNPIKKQRKSFMLNSDFCHIDIYDDLDGLCMLEIEFTNELDGVYFTMPDFALEFVLKEVSDNKFFTPFGLSLFGYFNNEKFDLSLTLKRILTTGVSPYPPPSLNVSKSVLSLLFSLILPLKNLCHSNIKQGYEALLSSARLLKAFANTAFDERVALIFSQNLEKISDPLANMLYEKGLLLYLKKHSKNRKKQSKNSKSMQLFIFLEKALAAQILALDELDLKEQLREYEIFLSDDEGFYAGKDAKEYSSISAARSLRGCVAGFVRAANRLSENSPNSFFFLASNFSSSTLLLMRYFGHCWGEIELKNLKKLDKILNKLRQNQAWYGIILRTKYQPKSVKNRLLARVQKLRTQALSLIKPSKDEALLLREKLKIYKRQ